MAILKVANVHMNISGQARLEHLNADNVIRLQANAVQVPVGTTSNRPTGGSVVNGTIRLNSTTGWLELYANNAWDNVTTQKEFTIPIHTQANAAYAYANTVGGNANNWANTVAIYANNWANSAISSNVSALGSYTNTAFIATNNRTNTAISANVSALGSYTNTAFIATNNYVNTAITTNVSALGSFTNSAITTNVSSLGSYTNTAFIATNNYTNTAISTNVTALGSYTNTAFIATNNYVNTAISANVSALGGYVNTGLTVTGYAWSNTIGIYANNWANAAISANVSALGSFTNTAITANVAAGLLIANSWANTIGIYANNWANSFSGTVGISANAYASAVGIAANSYASNVGVAANVYASAVGVAANAYAQSILTGTVSIDTVFARANLANLTANNAMPKTAGLGTPFTGSVNAPSYYISSSSNGYFDGSTVYLRGSDLSQYFRSTTAFGLRIRNTANSFAFIRTGIDSTSTSTPTSGYDPLTISIVDAQAATFGGDLRAIGDIVAYYSDERLKTDIIPIDNAVEKIKSIKGIYYRNNDTAKSYGYINDVLQVGVLSQDIEKVLPEVVTLAPFDIQINEDGTKTSISGLNYKTVKYERIIPLLIEAIKEQQKEIDMLKQQVKGLT